MMFPVAMNYAIWLCIVFYFLIYLFFNITSFCLFFNFLLVNLAVCFLCCESWASPCSFFYATCHSADFCHIVLQSSTENWTHLLSSLNFLFLQEPFSMPCVIWLNHFRNGREEWTEHTQCVGTPLIYKAQWYALFGGDFNYFFPNSAYLPLWCFWWHGTKFMIQAQSYFLFIFSISITLPLVTFSDKTSWETVRNKLFCSDFTCLMGGGTVRVLLFLV